MVGKSPNSDPYARCEQPNQRGARFAEIDFRAESLDGYAVTDW
jgi:hypothetical protein